MGTVGTVAIMLTIPATAVWAFLFAKHLAITLDDGNNPPARWAVHVARTVAVTAWCVMLMLAAAALLWP